jgi:hypothetical protein
MLIPVKSLVERRCSITSLTVNGKTLRTLNAANVEEYFALANLVGRYARRADSKMSRLMRACLTSPDYPQLTK